MSLYIYIRVYAVKHMCIYIYIFLLYDRTLRIYTPGVDHRIKPTINSGTTYSKKSRTLKTCFSPPSVSREFFEQLFTTSPLFKILSLAKNQKSKNKHPQFMELSSPKIQEISSHPNTLGMFLFTSAVFTDGFDSGSDEYITPMELWIGGGSLKLTVTG